MKNRNGFTLIELLIVVVVIGALAAIAIPRFRATQDKAHFSAMKADLRNLQAQQEIYYTSIVDPAEPAKLRYLYATSIDDVELGFTVTDGVKIDISEGTGAAGWSATATHKAFNHDINRSCVVYVGGITPLEPATNPDVVVCQGEK